jgi:hypothetical protein
MRLTTIKFNSAYDVRLSVQLAKQGKLDKDLVKAKLQALLNTDKHCVLDKVLTSPEEADGQEPTYRVMQQDKPDGTTEYVQFKLVENPNSLFRALGLSREDIEALLSEL